MDAIKEINEQVDACRIIGAAWLRPRKIRYRAVRYIGVNIQRLTFYIDSYAVPPRTLLILAKRMEQVGYQTARTEGGLHVYLD